MVLIGDNWPYYMYGHMIAVGSASCMFFIILQIFGKYVLLNLFLAILLENFEEIEISESGTHSTSQGDEESKSGEEIRRIKEESIVNIVKGGISLIFKRL